MNGERQLPTVAKEALEVLEQAFGGADDGFPEEKATTVIANDERFTESDAEYALDVLQSRGYIYCVDEQVYITPTDD